MTAAKTATATTTTTTKAAVIASARAASATTTTTPTTVALKSAIRVNFQPDEHQEPQQLQHQQPQQPQLQQPQPQQPQLQQQQLQQQPQQQPQQLQQQHQFFLKHSTTTYKKIIILAIKDASYSKYVVKDYLENLNQVDHQVVLLNVIQLPSLKNAILMYSILHLE
ncbi:hypothetical protein HELRODRAFT_178569 [Helobdella robusta]|uniref:Uncharacterized protein n=1 Tax=Helobdella robusta TaxID=6412 RepID=T1FDE4_HELRO|nr:hypothetical protein HELRODRAFT_178569 [Helobdella robusta]ESN97119.1 hypothetical protein HELRODRAFT_178569 [Helobdella robusta]